MDGGGRRPSSPKKRKGPEWHFVDDDANAPGVSCSRGFNLRIMVVVFFAAVFSALFYFKGMSIMVQMPGGASAPPTSPMLAANAAPDGVLPVAADDVAEASEVAETAEVASAPLEAVEEAVGGAGRDASVWPPPQCTGALPASRPKVVARRRRGLLSEAPTKLLVDSNPPDSALRDQVYDYLRDFMASGSACTPRSLAGTRQTCSGMGGGLSCRGKKLPACEPAPAAQDGRPPLAPKPSIFRGPEKFEAGSWGRCAFIATGENVLKADWGEHIDAHDTVIRYNTPIKGFEKHVGTKTSMMFTKDKYQTTAAPTIGWIIGGKDKPKGPSYTMRRQDILVLRDQSHRLWFTARGIKEGKAAAGLTRAMTLVKSGLCTHIDLYGFSTASKGRGGKYFAKKAIVTPGHTIDWDGWLLKAMMDLGYLCAYGE